MRYIPFSSPRQEFELEKAEIVTGSAGIKVKVMCAKAPYSAYLSDLNKQELINLTETTEKLEKYPGLKLIRILILSSDHIGLKWQRTIITMRIIQNVLMQ